MPEAQSEASTDLYVPTIDSVVATGYRRAGLINPQQSPSTVQLSVGRGILSEIIDEVSAEGIFDRQVEFLYVTLTAGQNQYLLAEDVIDIVGDGAYVDPTQSQVPFQAASETPVVMKDRDTWQNMSAKGAQARPYLGYFARNAAISTLFVWPTPSASENGGVIRFQAQRERPDVTMDGTKTIPFERYWTAYFGWAIAAYLAIENSLDPARVQLLEGKAAASKAIAKSYSKQNVGFQATISHRTPWRQFRR